MRIGITGAQGLIGRLLLRHLSSLGQSVHVSAYSGNILDAASVERWSWNFQPSIVFHLAAKVPSRIADSEKDGVQTVNGKGPALFASAMTKASSTPDVRFIYVSTSHVYASSTKPISEDGLVDPLNFYGATKLEGEQRLQRLESEGDIRLVVMRLFSVYSEDQGPEYLYGSLRQRVKESNVPQSISLPGWNNVRDFIHAAEAARIIRDLGLGSFEGVVNVGSGHGSSVKDFAEEQFKVQLLLSDLDKNVSPTNLVADVSLMHRLLG